MVRRMAACGALAAVLGLVSTPAAAAGSGSTTIGAFDPTPRDLNSDCTYTQAIYLETATASSGVPASPFAGSDDVIPAGGGTITSWSVNDQLGGAQLRLAVVSFGPGATKVTVDAFSPTETIPGHNNFSGVTTYAVDIPVRAGEQIGLDVTNPPSYHGCVYPGPSNEQVDVADDGYDGNYDFAPKAYFSASQLSLEATIVPSTSSPAPGRLQLSGPIAQRRLHGGRLELSVPVLSSRSGRVTATVGSARGGRALARKTARAVGGRRVILSVVLSASRLAELRRRHVSRVRVTVDEPGVGRVSRTIRLL